MRSPGDEAGTAGIAIIGMGCRLPGAANVRDFWRLLLDGGDAVGTYPGGRFPQVDADFAAAAGSAEHAAMALGGFLEKIDEFDAAGFELSPREAMYLDPQHRLLLEVAWAALEDAGQSRQDPKTSNTGVFAGQWASDFENVLYGSGAELEFYAMTGNGSYGASGRLSYIFGFEGPSITVDAACSSGLVAVHLACQSLLAGECDMALAGGANAILALDNTRMFTQAGMLAKDGRCKFGSEDADGFVRSEGAGMVVLKRLSDALAAGDPVRAVIRGSAVSNDGRASGALMTPSREGQRQTLHRAWHAAGVNGAEIRYFEAHGTGTAVGDPVEVGAIADALRDHGTTERCWIGSVKTNIGHTESAAGIAGLIKTVLALEHKLVPKSLLAGKLNPKIEWEAGPLRLLTETLDLSGEEKPVIAAISSFGLTGTNAHLVVQQYRHEEEAQAEEEGVSEPRAYLLPVSAASETALDALLLKYEEFSPSSDVRDVCSTASLRRRHDGYRAAFVCERFAEMKAGVAIARREGLLREGARAAGEGAPRIVFVAPGQGSQWAGMARELFAEEPVFRQVLEACDAAVFTETGWSLIEVLLGEDTESALQEIDVVQPMLFAMSVAFAALWRSWGIVPDAVIGHSMGEVAAAYIAGVLILKDAAAVICRRSRLMKTIRGAGAMLTVELPVKVVEALLKEAGGQVSIGASNSPETTVVSGDSAAIARLEAMLAEREVFCRRVKVDVASHSSQVDPILDELRASLSGIKPKTCELPLFSTVAGTFVSGAEMDAAYWAANLRQPVKYAAAVAALAHEGYNVFVELSPHPVLVPGTEATLRTSGSNAIAVASTRRGEPERRELLASLGALYCFGCEVNWKSLFAGPARCVALPEYPFQRERCWPELDELKVGALGRRDPGEAAHPLLGRRFESAMQPDVIAWEIAVDLKALPYLRDHRVHGTVVLPAAAQVELVLEALRAEDSAGKFALVEMRFESAMQIADDDPEEYQLGLRRKREGYSFEIRGRRVDGEAEWTRFSSGVAERQSSDGDRRAIDLSMRHSKSARHIEKRRHYRLRTRSGIGYGPAFQLLEEAWHQEGESLVKVVRGSDSAGKYVIHPALLDNCFQALQLAQPDGVGFLFDDTCLPVSIGRVELFSNISASGVFYCSARMTDVDAASGRLVGDLSLADEDGVLLGVVKGFELQRISASMEDRASELLTEIAWEPYEVPVDFFVARELKVLIFCDEEGVGEALAERTQAIGGSALLVRRGARFARSVSATKVREYAVDPDRREDLDEVFAQLSADGLVPTNVVHLWSLDQRGFDGKDIDLLLEEQSKSTYFVPTLIQAMNRSNWSKPPLLWMLTRGCVDSDSSEVRLAGAPMWGLGAAAAVEHPELQASLVDLSAQSHGEEADSLLRLIGAGIDEDRVAIRGAKMYVARFVPVEAVLRQAPERMLREDEEYSVEVPAPGILDHLELRASVAAMPRKGEVAIEIAAAALNFIDVTKAMGIYPGLDPDAPVRIGAECAGRVVEVGEGATAFKAGDEVVAISTSPSKVGLLASRVCLPKTSVFPKPQGLTLEEAAALPIAYLTAHYSLVELAHLRKGEWVLIPAGAGGVGLAAIQIALHVGAHVIATASTPEKQAYLRSLGVEHVLESRTLEFADEVRRITKGLGVDVVLNSLTGEYIDKSLELLRPFGRFIELGKRDIYDDRQIGLKGFRKNISYHAVDLAAAMEQRPEYVAEMLRTVLDRIEAGEWKALPVSVFPATDPAAPFHFMAQGKHTGKIVLRMNRDVLVKPLKKAKLFRGDAAYLITGGMGGVGSTVAEWMAANGAGCLVLISRREESAETRAIMGRIEALGARVVHARMDILDRHALERLLLEVRADMPPIAGLMHAATVIDDALVAELSPDRFDAVMGPKVKGTWNLYDAMANDTLDFMVLFSSIASVYPQPGHGSYAAANAFMDSFAHWARGQGRKVTSINWGGWEQIGLARETGTGRSISGYAQQGFATMAGARALSALKRVLELELAQVSAQVIASPIDIEQAAEFHGTGRVPPILRRLLAGANSGQPSVEQTDVQKRLAETETRDESVEVLQGYLVEELGRVLKLAPERIGKDTLFGSIGLDSLMTLEFVRRMKVGLGVAIPTTAVFNYPTAHLLAADIAKRMQLHLEPSGGTVESVETDLRASASALVANEMTEDEALQALMQTVVQMGGD